MPPQKKQPDADANKDAKTKPAWRAGVDFVGALALAILVAILIKTYVFDVYVIPSGSMETTLHGRPDGGDRVFCSKLSYLFRPVRRWEIAVFEFPYETAVARALKPVDVANKGQNYIKRVVGLPGESVALARGDVWTRKLGGPPDFVRQTKTDKVQRAMWLKVYEADLRTQNAKEFSEFWRISDQDAVKVDKKAGTLVLEPGDGIVELAYRPRLRAGMAGDIMAEPPGIPDRYVLRQPVQFQCRSVNDMGEVCGKVFTKTVDTQNITAHCPACGAFLMEDSVIYYQRRSGLAFRGDYAISPDAAPQGEKNVLPRWDIYHYDPDLRVIGNVSFSSPKSQLAMTIRDGEQSVQACLSAENYAEIRINGQPAEPTQRVTPNLSPGSFHTVEFYQVDGVVRLFVDSAEPILEVKLPEIPRPPVKALPTSTGVSISVTGGPVVFSRLAIDRDVFYISGREDPDSKFYVENFDHGQMSPSGDILVPDDMFLPLGDHTINSYDSRDWGPAPTANLMGPALFIWWPPQDIKILPVPDK